MELWFSDYHTDKVKISVKIEKQLYGAQTEYQQLDVFESSEFGRARMTASCSQRKMNLYMMK